MSAAVLQGPAFEEFRSTFKGDLVFPSDPDYKAAISRWAPNAERRAAVIAFVKDAEDVSLAIRFVRQTSLPFPGFASASDSGSGSRRRLPLAIKGGGHNPAGNSSAEDGLVIDLSRYVNTVRVEPEKRLAYAGGGALWMAVDEETAKYGLATTAGTVNDVSFYLEIKRDNRHQFLFFADWCWRVGIDNCSW